MEHRSYASRRFTSCNDDSEISTSNMCRKCVARFISVSLLNPSSPGKLELPITSHNMSTNNKFQGWLGHDKNAIGNMKWEEFEPKTWEETDVEIKITHSGYVVATRPPMKHH